MPLFYHISSFDAAPPFYAVSPSRIYDPSLCKLFVKLILQTLWTAHTPEQPPLIIVLDEAQRLHWGAGSMSAQILREGRKYEIAGWFSSQWIDHKDAISALGQAAYQIHFQPESQHIDKLAKLICTRPKERSQYQTLLQRLRRGEFVWQRENGQVVVVRVDS